MKRRTFLASIFAAFAATVVTQIRKVPTERKQEVFHGFGDNFRAAMKRKDPVLYRHIGSMSVVSGIIVWRQTYPEDFAGVTANMSVSWVDKNADRFVIIESPVTSAG